LSQSINRFEHYDVLINEAERRKTGLRSDARLYTWLGIGITLLTALLAFASSFAGLNTLGLSEDAAVGLALAAGVAGVVSTVLNFVPKAGEKTHQKADGYSNWVVDAKVTKAELNADRPGPGASQEEERAWKQRAEAEWNRLQQDYNNLQ
jgi:hypothetical protein